MTMADPVTSPQCRYCRCTDMQACPEGCFWVLPDVCSVCAIKELRRAGIVSDPLEETQAMCAGGYLPLDAVAELRETDDLEVPRLWRPGDPI